MLYAPAKVKLVRHCTGLCHRLSSILLPGVGPGITAGPESYPFLGCRDVVQVTKHGHILS